MTTDPAPSSSANAWHLPDADRQRLGEALQELLAHGTILGLAPADTGLYDWCRQNGDVLREAAALVGLTVHTEHESRLVQAVPQRPSLTLRLRQDATLVLLALWYEYDTQVREHGATQVSLTVEQLNQLLREKLLPDLKSQPSVGRLREVLVQARRFHLVRVDYAEPFESSRVEILPTLRRVIQFKDLDDWTRTADLHRTHDVEGSDGASAGGQGDESP
ncbi:MAG TPA: DUF4194 domain-containing protein [Tepidisphaeraceae bacterium]|nr:DUF4194 domain-containing protein [Tepidisphaeraceae bacterium]